MSIPGPVRASRRTATALAMAVCVLALGPRSAAAARILVPAEQPTIQAGIDQAAPGDTVLVAPGIYTGPGNRNLDFLGKNIRLVSAAGPQVTIIDGELADARGIHLHSGEGGFFLEALIDGFTIRNFRPGPLTLPADGAGIRIAAGCSPLVQNCVFTGNVAASGRGGGVSTEGGTVQFCRIEGNGSGGSVPGLGGGLYVDNATVAGCVIRENWASDLGGIPGAGGGVALPDGAVTRCLIIGNRAGIGGGVYSECGLFSVYLTACTIAGNFARVNAGGLAVACDSQADVTSHLCIIWGNGICGTPDISLDGDEVTAFLICTLLDPASVAGSGTPDYEPGCVFEDPQFCDPEECAGDPPFSDGYDLAATSPARGENNSCGQHMGSSHEVCAVAAAGEEAAPDLQSLGRPAPNPATTEVRIALAGPLPDRTRVQVYDAAGRLVRTLLDAGGEHGANAGDGAITWDLQDAAGARVPNGVYFVRLRSAHHEENRPLVVAR